MVGVQLVRVKEEGVLPSDCIFSPYFPANDPQRFAYVHKIYGGSNVGKMLQVLSMIYY
jgi:hypothetical protein